MANFIKYKKCEILKKIASEHKNIDWSSIDSYELIEITDNGKKYLIPVCLNSFKVNAYLSCELSKELLNKLNEFIFVHFQQSFAIEYINLNDRSVKKINRKNKFKSYKRFIINWLKDKIYYCLKFIYDKFKFQKSETNCPLEINNDTKCLMVAPHPDDEIIGAGGLMIKYSNNFDCICMNSSGISDDDNIEEAKHRSDVRVAEFNNVMETIGIKNHRIFEFYSTYFRFDKEMMGNLDNYCKVLNLKQYDYIFLPHPKDGHHEHKFVTNKLFPQIAKKIGYNPDTKIVFYEVWADMKNPNVFFDTSKNGFLYGKDCYKQYQPANSKLLGTNDYTLLDWKYKILSMYESQWVDSSIFITQSMRTKCLNNGQNPIWNFKVVNIQDFLK